MSYWLFKSESDIWSWQDQKNKGEIGEEWDGVRNYQARKHISEMRVGERGFFYHSQKERQIMGIIEIIRGPAPDSKSPDPRWLSVIVKAIAELAQPISLAQIKANPKLRSCQLVKYSRLSVQKLTAEEWREICTMAGYQES